MVFLKLYFEKVNLKKKNQQTKKSMQNYPACKELRQPIRSRLVYKMMTESTKECMLGNVRVKSYKHHCKLIFDCLINKIVSNKNVSVYF